MNNNNSNTHNKEGSTWEKLYKKKTIFFKFIFKFTKHTRQGNRILLHRLYSCAYNKNVHTHTHTEGGTASRKRHSRAVTHAYKKCADHAAALLPYKIWQRKCYIYYLLLHIFLCVSKIFYVHLSRCIIASISSHDYQTIKFLAELG